MTQDQAVGTEQHIPFKAALHRAWRSSSTGTVRYAGYAFGALVMLGVHVAMFVVADNTWSLIAVPALPAAAYFILAGWVYGRVSWRVLGLLLFVLGAMVPFYLM
ncbi:hypothetical protein ACT8ZV_04165 [Nocardioides sp. MAHUQ-72]|uniref:hypothetical protein n=1 Tax=unclassified Nocardioides TaxID=2615069 RepID=UPI00361D4634